MSKFLGSCRNEWQRVGRYKEGQKIFHEISIKSAIEQDLSGNRTGHLVDIVIRLQKHNIVYEWPQSVMISSIFMNVTRKDTRS